MKPETQPQPDPGLRQRLLRWARTAGLWSVGAVAAWLLACSAWLIVLRFVDPPTTGVQVQRRVESWFGGGDYSKRQVRLPLSQMSPHLPHAVIAAEDTRFYQHGGIDWKAIEEALEDNSARGRRRGGSTISQQLAKNLFLTTHSNWLRKGAEVPLTYLTEWLLPKERILELYINVAEWGPGGVFGAEAAARHYYGVPSASLTREQAARLAACLPSPSRRRPQQMDRLSGIVLQRMDALGY